MAPSVKKLCKTDIILTCAIHRNTDSINYMLAWLTVLTWIKIYHHQIIIFLKTLLSFKESRILDY